MSYSHVLDHVFDDFIPQTQGLRTRRLRIELRSLAAVAGAVAIGAALALALGAPRAMGAYEAHQAAKVQQEAARAALAPAELPREWRWERKAVNFEGMFRQER